MRIAYPKSMLIGHRRIWEALTRGADKNKLAHAYLFYGPARVGKTTLAKNFIQWLFCREKKNAREKDEQACGVCRSCREIMNNSHPDLLLIAVGNESPEIGIEQIRNLRRRLLFRPYKAPYKVVIIEEAQNLTGEAANAFLKTLEEPSARTLIILTSSAGDSVLPTIFSRCQPIKFSLVPADQMNNGLAAWGASAAVAEKILRLAAGRPGCAKILLENRDFLSEREKNLKTFEDILKADLPFRFEAARELSQDVGAAKEILSQWLLWSRDRLLEAAGRPDLLIGGRKTVLFTPFFLLNICREIKNADRLLSNSSLNARLILEILLIKI